MKYYPIGTVVTLKGGNRPIMIYGRKQMQAGSDVNYDYVACLYPEGNLSDEYNFFFQSEQIGKVHFTGYESLEEDYMQKLLQEV